MCLALGLLQGCGGTEPPTPTPVVSQTASAVPSPSPTTEALAPPERPAAMDSGDEAGAIAAATYFMGMFEYVLHTGDVATWDAVSAAACEFCQRVKADVTRVYGAGGSYTGGEFSIEQASVLGVDPQLGGYGVLVPYMIAAGAEIDEAGLVVAAKDAETGRAVIDTVFSEHGWVLVGFSQEHADS